MQTQILRISKSDEQIKKENDWPDIWEMEESEQDQDDLLPEERAADDTMIELWNETVWKSLSEQWKDIYQNSRNFSYGSFPEGYVWWRDFEEQCGKSLPGSQIEWEEVKEEAMALLEVTLRLRLFSCVLGVVTVTFKAGYLLLAEVAGLCMKMKQKVLALLEVSCASVYVVLDGW